MYFLHKINGFDIKPKYLDLTPTGRVNKLAPDGIPFAVQRRPIIYESWQISYRLINI